MSRQKACAARKNGWYRSQPIPGIRLPAPGQAMIAVGMSTATKLAASRARSGGQSIRQTTGTPANPTGKDRVLRKFAIPERGTRTNQ